MAGTSTRGLVSYRGVRLMDMSVERFDCSILCYAPINLKLQHPITNARGVENLTITWVRWEMYKIGSVMFNFFGQSGSDNVV